MNHWDNLFKTEFSPEYQNEYQKNRLRNTTRIRTELRTIEPNIAVINTGAVSKPPHSSQYLFLLFKGSEPELREEGGKSEFSIEQQQLWAAARHHRLHPVRQHANSHLKPHTVCQNYTFWLNSSCILCSIECSSKLRFNCPCAVKFTISLVAYMIN